MAWLCRRSASAGKIAAFDQIEVTRKWSQVRCRVFVDGGQKTPHADRKGRSRCSERSRSPQKPAKNEFEQIAPDDWIGRDLAFTCWRCGAAYMPVWGWSLPQAPAAGWPSLFGRARSLTAKARSLTKRPATWSTL